MEDYARDVIIEARLHFVSAGNGMASPIWGERKVQTCMASVSEEKKGCLEPFGGGSRHDLALSESPRSSRVEEYACPSVSRR